MFHKEPLRPPVLPGINIEHIGGGASEPATPGSASYNAEMERRRREAQEDQLYGKQLGEKIRIHTDMTQFQVRVLGVRVFISNQNNTIPPADSRCVEVMQRGR